MARARTVAKEETELDLDLGEVDDLDLGDIDIELDEADLDQALSNLDKEGDSLDNESLMLLTKEVRDGFAQAATLNKDRDASIKKTLTVVTNLELKLTAIEKQITELQAGLDKFVLAKASAKPEPVVEKPKAETNGTPTKTKEVPAEKPVEKADVSDAVRKKILDVYGQNYSKFSTVQKFAEAINAKSPGLAKETIVQVLSEAKLMGRGGTCKPPT
jgi:hypothetical protein